MAELADPDLPPDGTADVWWAHRRDASDRHAGLLDATERRRWAAYRRDEDRARFLAGCVLAKTALARLVLSTAERAALAAVPPADRARAFLVAWTRKEAVTKATGDGLRAAFSDVVVAADAGRPRLVSWPYPRSVHSVSLLDLDADPGSVAALAVIGRCEAVRARDGSALLADRA